MTSSRRSITLSLAKVDVRWCRTVASEIHRWAVSCRLLLSIAEVIDTHCHGGEGGLDGQDACPELRVGAPAATGVGREETAPLPPIPQQTVGGMAFELVPALLHRVELWSRGRELLSMQPGVALLARGDR